MCIYIYISPLLFHITIDQVFNPNELVESTITRACHQARKSQKIEDH